MAETIEYSVDLKFMIKLYSEGLGPNRNSLYLLIF